LAGLAEGTWKLYVQAVRRLAAHYHRSPDLLSEEEVRNYLLGLRQRGVARGTFQIGHYGLRFFYQHTLGRGWELSGGKRLLLHCKSRMAVSHASRTVILSPAINELSDARPMVFLNGVTSMIGPLFGPDICIGRTLASSDIYA
jgi:hypothetical protein